MSEPTVEEPMVRSLEDIPEAEWMIDAPTQDDLPCDDGIPMETYRHKLQMDILVDAYSNWLIMNQLDGFVGGNMFVYFSPSQVRNQDYRGPDVFVAMDVPPGERKSWVVWQEGKAPDVVIELLSDSTARRDKTEKKQIYQDRLRVPEYFWYDPFDPTDLAGFSLERGVYTPLSVDGQQRLISDRLGLALVRWQGMFKHVEAVWLRWATLEGELLPTDGELAAAASQRAEAEYQRAEEEYQRAEEEHQRAEEERQRAEEERQRAEEEYQRAEEERQRADRLAERLRQMGIDPNQV
jgi:Uma2 family endonuclease